MEPVVDAHIRDWLHLAHNTGIVECAVQAAKLACSKIDKRIGVAPVLYVTSQKHGFAIGLINRFRKSSERFGSACPEHYIGPFGCEQPRRRRAYPTACTGNDDNLTVQFHGDTLLCITSWKV